MLPVGSAGRSCFIGLLRKITDSSEKAFISRLMSISELRCACNLLVHVTSISVLGIVPILNSPVEINGGNSLWD